MKQQQNWASHRLWETGGSGPQNLQGECARVYVWPPALPPEAWQRQVTLQLLLLELAGKCCCFLGPLLGSVPGPLTPKQVHG